MRRLMRRIEIAQHRGWHAAAGQLTANLIREADYGYQRLAEFARLLRRTPPRDLPTESEIFREIMAVHGEFSEVEIDLEGGELIVTTDPIVLEDTPLGPFQIRLNVNRLDGRQPYRVVALDPNPAAANEAVTHPHIQDEHLCEGEGKVAIESALNAGRLLDFFLIVTRLLGTYARGSAYIELDDWDGIRCQDCGSLTFEDDRCHCERCDSDLCGECCLSCQGCQRGLCSECMTTCSRCGENYCRACLTACRACHEKCCENCLEDNLCENCHEQPDDEAPDDGRDSPADTLADAGDCQERLHNLCESTLRTARPAGASATV